jgi:hypothetical protein
MLANGRVKIQMVRVEKKIILKMLTISSPDPKSLIDDTLSAGAPGAPGGPTPPGGPGGPGGPLIESPGGPWNAMKTIKKQ